MNTARSQGCGYPLNSATLTTITPPVSGPKTGMNSRPPPIAASTSAYGTPVRKNRRDHTTNVITERMMSARTYSPNSRLTSSAMSYQSRRCAGFSMSASIPPAARSASLRMKKAKTGISTITQAPDSHRRRPAAACCA